MEPAETAASANLGVLDDKSRKRIADYSGDMLALESHIEEALDRQLKEVEDDPQAGAAVQEFHRMVKTHRETLKDHMGRVGSTPGNPIKAAGSALLGVAAGLVDLVRTEGVSKALRDDYTAFNLAAMGYTMLHTTASGLGDGATAALAERHLGDYVGAIQQINHIAPGVVVRELENDGHRVSSEAATRTTGMVDRVWKQADASEASRDFAG